MTSHEIDRLAYPFLSISKLVISLAYPFVCGSVAEWLGRWTCDQ